jgi:hypothetical protein
VETAEVRSQESQVNDAQDWRAENFDVQKVYSNLEITEELAEQFAEQ